MSEKIRLNENDTIEYIIDKLRELKIKAMFEDYKRGKVRYVSKASAYQDLINFMEDLYENN